MKKKQHFDMLQIFRAIACLLVVFHHAYGNFEFFVHKLDLPVISFISENGKYGVDFFFVLSGFIITYTTYKFKNDITYLKTYLLNRILKIYVPYLPISIVVLLLYKFTPLANVDRSISVITSLTLIPHGNTALLVAWTLVFEVFFYVIFSFNFISSKIWNIFVVIWTAGILFVNYIGIEFNNAYLNLIFNLYNLEFVMGFVVALTTKKEIILNKFYVSAVLILVLSTVLWMRLNEFEFFTFSSNLLVAFCCSILVYLFVYIWNIKIDQKNLFMRVGNSSYSLYLVHTLFFALMFRLLPPVTSQSLAILSFYLLILICCLVSYLYYIIFEQKMTKYIKSKVDIKKQNINK